MLAYDLTERLSIIGGIVSEVYFEVWSLPPAQDVATGHGKLVLKTRYDSLCDAVEAAERNSQATFVMRNDGEVMWTGRVPG
jgi:hypothetical protein